MTTSEDGGSRGAADGQDGAGCQEAAQPAGAAGQAGEPMHSVDVNGVEASYGRHTILHDVSMHAMPGEQIAIIGRNGSGKSTLLQIMAGIIRPDAGRIVYYGHDVTRRPRELTRFCGYLPQGNPLAQELTVRDNVALWSGSIRAVDPSILDVFHLRDILDKPVRSLSGGMKRRVSIACAVVRKPPVLIMDEPTAALDIYYRREIRDWMRWYCQGNGTIVVATHDDAEIRASSRCYLLDGGTLTPWTPGDALWRPDGAAGNEPSLS